MNGVKYVVLGLVALLLLTVFSGVHAGGATLESSQGEEHLYLVVGYDGPGVIRDYGNMKLVKATYQDVRNAGYFERADYMENVLISGMSFDPLENYPKSAGLLSRATSKYYLVQFNGPVTTGDIENLREYGDVIWYIPHNTYVVRLRVSPEKLGEVPNLRWYGIYQPYFRMDQGIRDVLLTDPGISIRGDSAVVPAGDLHLVRVVLWSSGLKQLRVFQNPRIMRFGNLEYVTGYVSDDDLQVLANDDDVLWIENYVIPVLYDEKSDEIIGGVYSGYGTWVNSHLLRGDGVIVAVADTGLDTGSGGVIHPDLSDRAIAFWSANGDDAHDGHGHGTHVAGIIAGTAATGERDEDGYLYGLGVAPHAHIVVEKIFSDSGGWLSPDYVVLGSFAQANGAVISSNSWGANTGGAYTTDSQIYDILTRDANPDINGTQELLFVFAAGNAGPGAQTVGSPATAKNVLTVGAVGNNRFGDSYQNMASFSSRGPAADGRLKPDVVAPGTWIASALSQRAHPGWAWGNIDRWYEWCGGTSQATPHVSGAAALFVQYYRGLYGRDPSPALIKAALINTAIDLNGTDAAEPIPNNNEGWGMVYLPNLIDPPYGEIFIDENATLSTGDVYRYNVSVQDSSRPLKITMVYTDREASTSASVALVNNLNLVVHAPNGTVYVGNNFSGGWTQPGMGPGDARNNTENVYIENPVPGNYTIEVIAENVPMDAVPSTPAVDQDFALVITGDVGSPNHYSAVRFSRNYYRPTDTLNIYALDSYANTNPAEQELVRADLRSSATGDYERVVLMEIESNGGVFNASVPMEVGTANPGDGVLQVSSNDTVMATYRDFLGSMRTASTHVDGVPPEILNITVLDVRSTSAVVHLRLSEPASIAIHYGTPGHLGNVSYDGINVEHDVLLSGLIPYTHYNFYVVVEDRAGNTVVDDNHGNYYSFMTALPPNILVVADDAGYYTYSTAFLVQEIVDLGYDLDVWDTASQGSPPLSVLEAYPVVFWNTGPDWSSSTLTAEDQSNLAAYMDHGGRLVLMGQDIIWGIGLTDFIKTYFHISSVSQDVITGSQTTVYGVAGNPITGNYTSGLSLNSTYSLWIDELTSDGSPEVSSLFRDTNGKDIGVMVNNTTYRAVFMAFPYECLAVDEYPAAGNITWNMIRWLLPGKDVFVLYSRPRPWTVVGSEYYFRVLVGNRDSIPHGTNLTFEVINSSGALVHNVSMHLDVPSGGLWLTLNWTATEEDVYNITVSVEPASGESVTINNAMVMQLYARVLKGTIRVVVLDSWISDYGMYGDLDTISGEWYRYGNYILEFDTSTLNKEGITFDDILSTDADVLLISNAWSSSYGWEFSDSEISAIKMAVARGTGIVATSGTFDSANAPNNMKLASLFGLNQSVGGRWADRVTQFTLLNASHPVFSGLPSPLPTEVQYACVGLVPDGAVVLAMSDNGSSYGKPANITEYRYGGGEALYLPTIAEYFEAGDNDMHLLYNMLVYAKLNSSPIEYDLAALNLSTDREWVEPGDAVNVTVNVMNIGTHEDTGTLSLYATYENGTEVLIGTKTLTLAGDSRAAVTFSFSPVAEGRIALRAVIISKNDTVSGDNETTGYVYARIPHPPILIAGVDSLGAAYPSMMIWDDLKEHWYRYGNRTLEFDMGTLVGKNITYQDLVNSRADVLVISDAWRNVPASGIWWEFSDSEIAAIEQYVSEGHGLIMTSGTFYNDSVPNNMKLASMAGLDPNTPINWANTFNGEFDVNMSYNESSEIFRGVDVPYVSGATYTAYGWALNSSDPADLLARSTDGVAGVFFHRYHSGSVVYFSHIPEYAAMANMQDRQLFYNAIVFTYLNSTKPVTDNSRPELSFVSPADGEVVGGWITVEVNATDNISWIPEVKVYLVNSTANISFNTTHDYAEGVFKVGIDTTLYADGNYTLLAWAEDYYGNTNWTRINVTIDNTMPSVRILSPTDGSVLTDRNVTVKWSCVDAHLHHIEVEIDGEAWIDVGLARNHTFTNLSLGEHTVVVRAFDVLGHTGSYGVSFTVAPGPVPSAPLNITVVAGASPAYINVSWDPPSDTGGLQILEYRIYRGTSSGAEVYIGNVSGDVHYFNDTSVEVGRTYYYYITAVNANGEGETSEEVSATITPIPEMEMIAVPVLAFAAIIALIRRRH